MADDTVHFALSDRTLVIVKKVMNNKYDFQLKLYNGRRKTFVWSIDSVIDISDRKGLKDKIIMEAIKLFKEILENSSFIDRPSPF